MKQRSDHTLFSPEHRFARRTLLRRMSLIGGGAALALVGGGMALQVSHAAGDFKSIQSLYRLNHTKDLDHFYTIGEDEKDGATKNYGYRYEGIACRVLQQREGASAPVYRLNHTKNLDHFYTISEKEKDSAIKNYGYRYEGIAFYVFPL